MKQFAEEVRTMVEESTGKEVKVVEVEKVNGPKTAICIIDGDMGANFYIKDFYESGMTASECADEIVQTYTELPRPKFDPENFDFGFDSIKDKLIVRTVGIERNGSLLDTLVHKDMGCGLAIVPAIMPTEEYVANVSKTLAENNGFDEETLIDAALESCEKIEPAVLTSIMSAMFGNRENILEMDDTSEAIDESMLVLTNKSSVGGASVIFYKGLLKRVRDILGQSFYVLPSSIHEVILVPVDKDVDELKEVVMGANKNVVSPEDVLSDDVYIFDGELRKVA